MFPSFIERNIEKNLNEIVTNLEAENPHLSVLSARQFRYSVRQYTVELTVKEPRQFNVLEEFIIRAGLEFDPPPTAKDLASILALDSVFIERTISTLQSLQTLTVNSTITVTQEGRLFYEKGTVPQPPYNVNIYAIVDAFEEDFSFNSESFDDDLISDLIKLPNLADIVPVENKEINISNFKLEKIQEVVSSSGLNFHVPELGKLVTDFQVIPPTKTVTKMISIFIIFDVEKDGLIIQAHSGKQFLSTASKKLTSLLHEDKISLPALSGLSQENINSVQKSGVRSQEGRTAVRPYRSQEEIG
jgi:hypothetical protein